MQEIIGWGSAFIILPTFGLQVYKQWQNRNEHAPVLAVWFFVLALTGAAGQIAYSWMLGNWVYLVLNICLVVTDSIGLALVVHRRWMIDDHGSEGSEKDHKPHREPAKSGVAQGSGK